ncbi:MerR family transcriptional regulator [Ideonella paludis]|uniref:MerR family transcriptional regulator n=1 Tax=Ideonella paludis TaxID=1233411 RepID=A0ABS5E1M0_9BURK|nr:MerR family transcriptional regulator [Ideonella paludis]MBQ0937317.1 MerR family transcriptional regulator [Ideonella paludis]
MDIATDPLAPLPAIPAKRYFTIGEVAELCGVKSYVLRYWEQEFTQLRPMKRRGNRRYYQHHEVLLIRRIRDLLYEQGFTISGARNRLTELGLSEAEAQAHAEHLARDHAAAQSESGLISQQSFTAEPLPTLGSRPSAEQVRHELMAIRELLSA